jgi:hypothetical protein
MKSHESQEKQEQFHDLRHIFASHFVMKGGDIFVLQRLLGHSSIQMTQRYAHMSQNYLNEASQIINFKTESDEDAPDLNHSDVIEGNFRANSLGISRY